jgi:hypothetical protein
VRAFEHLAFEELTLDYLDVEETRLDYDGRPTVGDPDLLLMRLQIIFPEPRFDIPELLLGWLRLRGARS